MWIDGREWKLVPVEPTDEMLYAGRDAIEDGGSTREVFLDMLDAAPTPPEQASGQAAPSDADIDAILLACGYDMRIDGFAKSISTRELFTAFARALLARYGRPAGEAQPVAWVAADTLHSPHPRCISSLAYMSQIDQDRGREYVPLYAAQKADDARDAERWREVERRARKHTAYDRYGDGAHWSVGVFSDDSRQTFGGTIDAAIAQRAKEPT